MCQVCDLGSSGFVSLAARLSSDPSTTVPQSVSGCPRARCACTLGQVCKPHSLGITTQEQMKAELDITTHEQ